jgi:radical SAM protein (TIGR01212 family)
MREMDRYPFVGDHWKKRFGERVWRVPLDAGLGCPNRDSVTGAGGCVFCDPVSFAPRAGRKLSVTEQLQRGTAHWGARGIRKFAAYFQSGTNTHAASETLRRLWDEAAAFPEVVVLCVGTRPDCVDEEVLDLLAGYRTRFGEIWLEIGLQSANDATLARLHRGHTAADFAEGCRRARERGLLVCAHAILGLPGEDEADEAATADFLRECGAEGVKLHHLAVVKGTELAALFERGEIPVLGEEAYVGRAVAFLRRLPPSTVIHRFVGDTGEERLLAPKFLKPRVAALIRAGL